MDERERFEELLGILDELAELNATTPIVVEGARDVASLRALGLRGEIHPLHAGEPLFQVAERLATATREVVLLTDWDRKGELLFDQLSAHLSANGVRINRFYRDRIPGWVRPALKDVESLAGYVRKGLERFHATTLEERASRAT
ncbi:MAG TPA: toprim domain-containing protein [Candidatus Thermoplasmatota archaeon]|nr:toprim domain-containing protein [Candidatus Thermoplasmatota archaeon]